MATKTYLGFQSQLKSKDLTEAIALQHGPGPLFGYAGFSISTSSPVITLSPTPDSGDGELKDFRDHFNKLVNDRMASRRVLVKALDGNTGNFGIVTKDGYIEVNNSSNIAININNTQSTYPEVIVLARHNYSEDVNVEMPVLYEAYWNQSNISFFRLYKKAIDYNYPTQLSSREVEGLDINKAPHEDSQLSYNYLLNTALSATGVELNNLSDCTLVGIYGTGNDAMSDTGSLQKFIILPYDGKFPNDITYTWSEFNFYKDLLRYLYKVFDGMGNLTFEEYLRKLTSKSDEEEKVVSVSLPVGTIVMWYGSTSTIPYGWEICDGTASVHNPSIIKPNLMGRFPVGLGTGNSEYNKPGVSGGNNKVTLEIENIPKHTHIYTADANSEGKFASVETGFPKAYTGTSTEPETVTGTAGSSGNQGEARAYHTSTVGGSKPIDIRPEYTVVAFIIKTLE